MLTASHHGACPRLLCTTASAGLTFQANLRGHVAQVAERQRRQKGACRAASRHCHVAQFKGLQTR